MPIKEIIGKSADIISESFKFNKQFPKFHLYTTTGKKEDIKNYVSLYFSKHFNKFFLIIRLNVENLSISGGKIYSVTINSKNKYFEHEDAYPIPLSLAEQDTVLKEYLLSDRFNGDTYFEQEIEFAPRDKKTLLFVFDVNKNYGIVDSMTYIITYRCSCKKSKIKHFEFVVPSFSLTKHYRQSEIHDFRKAKRLESQGKLHL